MTQPPRGLHHSPQDLTVPSFRSKDMVLGEKWRIPRVLKRQKRGKSKEEGIKRRELMTQGMLDPRGEKAQFEYL